MIHVVTWSSESNETTSVLERIYDMWSNWIFAGFGLDLS